MKKIKLSKKARNLLIFIGGAVLMLLAVYLLLFRSISNDTKNNEAISVRDSTLKQNHLLADPTVVTSIDDIQTTDNKDKKLSKEIWIFIKKNPNVVWPGFLFFLAGILTLVSFVSDKYKDMKIAKFTVKKVVFERNLSIGLLAIAFIWVFLSKATVETPGETKIVRETDTRLQGEFDSLLRKKNDDIKFYNDQLSTSQAITDSLLSEIVAMWGKIDSLNKAIGLTQINDPTTVPKKRNIVSKPTSGYTDWLGPLKKKAKRFN